jgi:hypothetical protein
MEFKLKHHQLIPTRINIIYNKLKKNDIDLAQLLLNIVYGEKYANELIHSNVNYNMLVKSAVIIADRGTRYCNYLIDIRGTESMKLFKTLIHGINEPVYQHIGFECHSKKWIMVKYITWTRGMLFISYHNVDQLTIISMCKINNFLGCKLYNKIGNPMDINNVYKLLSEMS